MNIAFLHADESTSRPCETEVLLYFVDKVGLDNIGTKYGMTEELNRLQDKNVFRAEAGQVYLQCAPHVAAPVSSSFIMWVGLGEKITLQQFKEAAASAARSLVQYYFRQVAALIPSINSIGTDTDVASAIVEGFLLGSYRPQAFSTSDTNKVTIEQLLLFSDRQLGQQEKNQLETTIKHVQIVAEATNHARDWINTPGNKLTPQIFAQEARHIAEAHRLDFELIQGQDLLENRLYGLHHVGKGSENPPLCILLRYRGNPDSSEVLGLVGKGITFDTGGISLKEADGLEELVDDMGGAAAVLAVMKIIGQMKPKVNVEVVLPCAENMPSGSAYKPGDVIPTLSGKTIEVINTDAEGRIVLADGVTLAQQRGATRVIDVATLTGAVVVALGTAATGAVTNEQSFMQALLRAAEQAGEKVWPFPVYDEYKAMLRSEKADLRNSCGKEAAAITAGLFIGAFAEEVPWIHLDIGGSVRLKQARGVDPAGGTGVMVRTLAEYVCHFLVDNRAVKYR